MNIFKKLFYSEAMGWNWVSIIAFGGAISSFTFALLLVLGMI